MSDAIIVGADIGWSTEPSRESTGLCTIVAGELVDCSLATTDEEILNYAIKRDADFVGIDAPLVVPNFESRRPVEDELGRHGYSAYPANRELFNRRYGGIRGEILVEKLESYGYTLSEDTSTPKSMIEVYPNPTIRATIGEIPKYKNVNKAEMHTGVGELWRRTIESIGDVEFGEFEALVPDSPDDVTKGNLKAVGDLIDAFYSAYVLKLDLEYPDRTEVFGALETGSILTASE